jgi:succinyldiaminopimelate transaminase
MLELPDFPWNALVPARDKAAAHPDGIVDLSVGSPVDETPKFIRDALGDAADAHSYPTTQGAAALRQTIVTWFERVRGVRGLDQHSVIPSVGSKEFVGLLPLFLGLGDGDAVVHPTIAYPTYDIGARVVGATPLPSDDPDEWPENTRLVWLNSPANPTGRVSDSETLRRAVTRARELGAVIANDECYATLNWNAPEVPSILDQRVNGGSLDGVIAAYSLSKQSNLAGYRAAFVAGDPKLVAGILETRKHLGLITPTPVQAAMTVALADDEHANVQREVYRSRRERLLPALKAAGFTIEHSNAGLYLWVSQGKESFETVDWFAEKGILVAPGSFYGEAGNRNVRVALTASDERIEAAVSRLA